MTGRLHVTPKTTEQNLILSLRSGKSEVTNNKRLRLRYCILSKQTTDRQEASRGLSATAKLLVSSLHVVISAVLALSTHRQSIYSVSTKTQSQLLFSSVIQTATKRSISWLSDLRENCKSAYDYVSHMLHQPPGTLYRHHCNNSLTLTVTPPTAKR